MSYGFKNLYVTLSVRSPSNLQNIRKMHKTEPQSLDIHVQMDNIHDPNHLNKVNEEGEQSNLYPA